MITTKRNTIESPGKGKRAVISAGHEDPGGDFLVITFDNGAVFTIQFQKPLKSIAQCRRLWDHVSMK